MIVFSYPLKQTKSMCILVQDHLLLAAPCKWVHHLCTDLKEESKCSETDGETSMSHGCLYESLHRQFTLFTWLQEMQEDFLVWSEAPILHLKTNSKGKLPVHQAQGEKERDGDSNCDSVFSFILGRGFWGRWCLLADHRDRVYDESHDVMKSQLTTFLSAFDEGSL